MSDLEHEEVVVVTGKRSGLPVIVAVHSTVLGQAVGGCRIWNYPDWREGLEDALRLSEAMTLKCAAAGLPHGGGKAVIPLPQGFELVGDRRRSVLLDLGDVVESLGGRYGTGEDVGTSAEDILIVREQTPYAYCLPVSQGGSGEPSEPTAVGVMASIRTVVERLFGTSDLIGRRLTIIGLGQVGSRLARRLTESGAALIVSDIDSSKRALGAELGAEWAEPEDALTADTDVRVPAALGGILTRDVADRLRCKAIVGPANNQLADDSVAGRLEELGIVWAPDFVVNAGGAIHGTMVDVHGIEHEAAMKMVDDIGRTLSTVFQISDAESITPLEAALGLARRRIEAGRVS